MPTNNSRRYERLWRLALGGAVGACIALGGGAARAASAEDDTLVRIAQNGRIVLGAHDGSVPLSYLDAMGTPIGYHMDVCLRIVKAIQQRLELPALKVVTVPTNEATRFALLNNGTIDIECARNPVRPSALAQALLSHATLITDIRLMTRMENATLTLDTLGGRSVGMAAGSSAAAPLRALARKSGSRITEVFGRLGADTFALLDAGRVDVVALPTTTLIAQRQLAADPARYLLVGGVLLTEPVALMFRLRDEKLHALANEVLDGMMKTGEMARLYDKWFVQPIPGLPQALGLPLPPALRALFDAPGSELLTL